MQQSGRSSLVPLTGARFFAALWVVLYHSTTDFGFASWLQQLQGPSHSAFGVLVMRVIRLGPLGVDFFFLLSGFILAYQYLAADGRVRGGKRAFWIARVGRIYPVYLLAIVLGLLTYLRDAPAPSLAALTIASHVLLIQSWIPAAVPLNLNPPAWSLAAEALFYALFPFLLPACARLGRLGRRALLVAAGGAWAVYTLLHVGFAVLAARWAAGSDPTWGFIVAFNPLVQLPEFLVGLALGLSFVQGKRAGQASPMRPPARPARRSLHHLGVDVGVVGLVGALGALCVLAPQILSAIPVPSILAILVIPIVAPLISLLALQRGLVAWALSLRPVAWLGEISYGVYILHWPLWALWHRYVLADLPFDPSGSWSLIAYLLVLVTAAGLSYRYFEAPARRAIRARWGKPTTRVGGSVAAVAGWPGVPAPLASDRPNPAVSGYPRQHNGTRPL